MLSLSLPRDLLVRLRSYARQRQIEPDAAATELVEIALDHLDARRQGAEIVNASRSATRRREIAQQGGAARWAKRRVE